jgi:hypothetical protein
MPNQACYQGHLGCVALLLDAGCNVFLLDQYGNAPCDIFCDQVSRELSVEVRLLIAQHKTAIAAASSAAAAAAATVTTATAAGKSSSSLRPDNSSSQATTTPCSPAAGGQQQQHRGCCRAHGGSTNGSSSEPCVCVLRKKASASSSTTNNRWAGADRYRQRSKRQWRVTDRYFSSNGSSVKVAVLGAAAAECSSSLGKGDGGASCSGSAYTSSSAAGGVIDLHAAAREGAVLVMKQALEEGVCVNTRDCNGMTALMWAAQCGR